MVNAIIIIFIIVPNPGISFNGIQKIKTMQLIIKVERPIPILAFFGLIIITIFLRKFFYKK